jgi:hypothetical protein
MTCQYIIVSIFIISESYSLLLVIRCNGITVLSSTYRPVILERRTRTATLQNQTQNSKQKQEAHTKKRPKKKDKNKDKIKQNITHAKQNKIIKTTFFQANAHIFDIL